MSVLSTEAGDLIAGRRDGTKPKTTLTPPTDTHVALQSCNEDSSNVLEEHSVKSLLYVTPLAWIQYPAAHRELRS